MFLERKFASPTRPGAAHRKDVLPNADWSQVPSLVYDVVSNVQRLLRARRGFDHLFPDFGITPLNGWLSSNQAVDQLNREVPETLRRYEPRLRLDKMDFDVSDDGTNLFIIHGSLVRTERKLLISFEIDSRRIVHVDYDGSTAIGE
jgi:predicted component of type VI protein secretion system